MKTKQEDTELTARQAALKLGVRLQHFYTLVWDGSLPATKRDGKWFVPASAIETRLKSRERAKEAASA